MNSYQAANLLGLMKRSEEHRNGNWFEELAWQAIEVVADDDKRITNRFGDELPSTASELLSWMKGL